MSFSDNLKKHFVSPTQRMPSTRPNLTFSRSVIHTGAASLEKLIRRFSSRSMLNPRSRVKGSLSGLSRRDAERGSRHTFGDRAQMRFKSRELSQRELLLPSKVIQGAGSNSCSQEEDGL